MKIAKILNLSINVHTVKVQKGLTRENNCAHQRAEKFCKIGEFIML